MIGAKPGHVWTAPRGKRDLTVRRGGRVGSCLRPADAAHMTAGPDKSADRSPIIPRAVKRRLDFGLLRSLARPVRHHVIITSPVRGIRHADPLHAVVERNSNSSPRLRTAQAIRTILVASPTDATMAGHRDRRAVIHPPRADPSILQNRMTADAPITSRRRRYGSPCFGDMAEALLAATRTLTRHQADPSRQLAT